MLMISKNYSEKMFLHYLIYKIKVTIQIYLKFKKKMKNKLIKFKII